ncbi:hypothetical protein AX16_000240 [Volvariella volvacea WC 439]|nr:hypothetical protein AX16_000240 [Volvariella volvacea WC 439]
MSDILKAYKALTAASPRSDVTSVLQSIVNALPPSDPTSHTELISALLDDLKACSAGSESRLTTQDAAQALLAVKMLGKNPTGSAHLATEANFKLLLSFTSTFKNDQDASGEALRAIANALLLIDRSRSVFIDKEVDGGDICVGLTEQATSPDMLFVLSRILFLVTASGPSLIRNLVEDKYHGRTFVDILSAKLELLAVELLTSTRMAKEAMVDMLKLAFNLLLHYPKMVETDPQTAREDREKVMGDFWNAKLNGLLPPMLRLFNTLPPTFPCPIAPPLTHVIHSLITIPISPSLKPIWFASNYAQGRGSASGSPKNSGSGTPARSHSSSRSDSPTRNASSSSKPSSPKPSTLDRALNVLAGGRRSLSISRNSSSAQQLSNYDVLQRAWDLLEVSFLHYFPGTIDPDTLSIRTKVRQESPDNTLDDMLSPLLVLISRLCLGDENSRSRVRQWLVPEDLDRDSPLEGRPDLLGRCLRLLGSVYHQRLKDAVGEMLFAMADSNASTLSALVGYGNVAGFLFHKGVVNVPPPDMSSTGSSAPLVTPSGKPINPITGTTQELKLEAPEMDDDEKEREMEKLFVLFQRLESTGALPKSQNPIRKAIQEGKLNM